VSARRFFPLRVADVSACEHYVHGFSEIGRDHGSPFHHYWLKAWQT